MFYFTRQHNFQQFLSFNKLYVYTNIKIHTKLEHSRAPLNVCTYSPTRLHTQSSTSERMYLLTHTLSYAVEHLWTYALTHPHACIHSRVPLNVCNHSGACCCYTCFRLESWPLFVRLLLLHLFSTRVLAFVCALVVATLVSNSRVGRCLCACCCYTCFRL